MHRVIVVNSAPWCRVAWSGIEGKGLHQLLCCPLDSWMFGHVKVNDFSGFVMQNDKHVEDSKCGSRDGEKSTETSAAA
jgi:hypothetical protein